MELHNALAKQGYKSAEKYRKKINSSSDKDRENFAKNLYQFSKYSAFAQAQDEIAQQLSKSLDSLLDGSIQAGRDFIVQRDYDYNVLFTTRTEKLVFKDPEIEKMFTTRAKTGK